MGAVSRSRNGSGQLQAASTAETSYLAFFKRQFVQPVPLPVDLNLVGKAAIVTGANAGLGFESSRQLLQAGLSRLILAVRSQTRGDAAAEKLRREYPGAEVLVWILDMDSYESIQAFAARCAAELDDHQRAIDIVILNAGIQRNAYEAAPATEHELVLQVNYLSTMLLAILLLPIMKQGRRQRRGRSSINNSTETPSSPPPVLTVVTSDTAYVAPALDASAKSIIAQLNSPDSRKNYSSFFQYAQSKVLQQSFVPRLAACVDPDDVVLNLVNPGLCRDTAFSDGVMSGLALRAYHLFMAAVARTVEVGATTYVDAVAVKGKESHGSLISDWRVKPFPPSLYGETGQKIQDTLWEETLDEFEFAGAREIVARLGRD
ncbi:hypothetical protein Micbo1qcDRAFT_166724 [Microdochium bolleyi]|uniref:Short-chain dehydrogenase/reductase family protein n=1 Tax=Microdochium bolleyi TaxID=196109 RepID=A0A136IV10_9PEZI|nr:hypothetical protein Micbo1qcDRAFT_166724 [Microdochium bolleyi]